MFLWHVPLSRSVLYVAWCWLQVLRPSSGVLSLTADRNDGKVDMQSWCLFPWECMSHATTLWPALPLPLLDCCLLTAVITRDLARYFHSLVLNYQNNPLLWIHGRFLKKVSWAWTEIQKYLDSMTQETVSIRLFHVLDFRTLQYFQLL